MKSDNERHASNSPSTSLEALRARVGKTLEQLSDPQPQFTYRLAWNEDYDALFAGRTAEQSDVSEIADRAKGSGRVMLCARGGGAKTAILNRIARLSFSGGDLPIIIDLKRWRETTYSRWKQVREDGLQRVAFLMAELSPSEINLREIEGLPADVCRIILVDGLNEVKLSTGNEILAALERCVRRSLNVCAIVSDRLVRRELPNSERWQLATIQPLSEQEIRRQIEGKFKATTVFDNADSQKKALIATPYFLDVLLRSGDVAPSSSEAFHRYFREHVSLTEAELAVAGKAAFRAYEIEQSRVFNPTAFAEIAGVAVWEKLRSSGAVREEGTIAFFTHHLKHDYLASFHVSSDPRQWHRDAFQVVTLGASSFDAIAMALEQVPNSDSADLLVRRVYDWNPYAAAYATAEGLSRLSVRVSPEMEIVLLAMLGERTFDLIETTAQRAKDALHTFPQERVQFILTASNLADIIASVLSFRTHAEWFEQWRNLFTREICSPASDADIQSLFDEDSITGWTSANVLKRLSVSNDQLVTLRQRLVGAGATIRWRIVHVLGAFPSAENVNALFAAMEDSDEWVRYGAIRSLVEIAALSSSEELRASVFQRLSSAAESLTKDRRRLEELERVLFVRQDKAPGDWLRTAGNAIEGLYQASVDVERREHWRRLAHSFALKYADHSAA